MEKEPQKEFGWLLLLKERRKKAKAQTHCRIQAFLYGLNCLTLAIGNLAQVCFYVDFPWCGWV